MVESILIGIAAYLTVAYVIAPFL
ncbi:uncharacterized protein METZ01_LOCUS133489 [marine metagenome]|uniref:Uncharacterized protein n=1 Tax=marine metagenome TaxID=408172 RepID=A0A381YUE3_9ZZZZ